MQKRLKMLITLVLALMMILTSAFAEGTDTGAGEGTAAGEQTAASTETVETPTAEPTAVAPAEPTAEPTEAASSVPPTDGTTDTSTEAPAEVTTPATGGNGAETVTPAPTVTTPVTGGGGAAPATNTPTTRPATPTPQPTTDSAAEDDFEGEIKLPNPEEAEAVDVAANGRATWVVLNISMRNLSDERANASMKMAQFVLARSVADGKPVSIFFQKKGESQLEFDKELITSAEEWDALIETLAQAGYSNNVDGKNRDGILAFWDFVLSVGNESAENVDVWVLQTNATETVSMQGGTPITNFLKTPGISVNFRRFQKEGEQLDKDEDWLDEMIAELGVSSFTAEPLYYQDVVANPIKQAMKEFDLNLLAPSTDRQIDADGNMIWKHAGMDTLLILTTNGSPVSVTAQQVEGKEKAFPIVMKMSETQYMVLLRNVAPGTYNIVCEDKAPEFQVAYKIENAEITIEGAPEDGAAAEWFLQDQKLVVGLNLPQVKPDDVGKMVLINGVEKTAEDGVQFLLKQQDETGMQWVVKIPRQELGEGTIEFRFKVSAEGIDYEVATDPEKPFRFIVKDRPLDKTADRVDFTYYYNVPGCENAPVSVALAQYFVNPDEQPLIYAVTPDQYTVENDTLNYMPEDLSQSCEIQLDVKDLPDAVPLKFVVAMNHVDFIAEAENWKAQMAQTEYEARLGQELLIPFALPAEAGQLYESVRKQYPELPEGLENALHVCAELIDSEQPDASTALPVTLTVQADGSIAGELQVPAYDVKKDKVSVTFAVMLLGQTIEDQTIIDACSFTVPNDSPVIAEGIPQTLEIKAGIQGAPGNREPLTFTGINAAQKDAGVSLPDPFIPADLFTDRVHKEDGLTITIKAEPADLVKLVKVETDETGETVKTEVAEASEGEWVLDASEITQEHELQILDKGTVTLNISIKDDDIPGEQEIVWTFKVNSPFDTTVLIVSITAAVLAITVLVLLILRQIRKPSFARMNSEMNMRVITNYSPNSAYTVVPMGVYGKKETDLAHLFIACQQPPLNSMPIDVLADVAVQPGKRRSYRLVMGKRAEKLNVVVDDQAQNTQKPVVFGQDQAVQIYADMNERVLLQISAER